MTTVVALENIAASPSIPQPYIYPNSALIQPAPKVTDFTYVTGPYTINGVATAHGGGPNDVLLVRSSDNQPLLVKRTNFDGSYLFSNLPAGNYALVVFDPTGTYRAKVIHTTVFAGIGFASTAFTAYTLTIGSAMPYALSATGGLGAVTYTLDSGTLPAGITLNTNGTFSGTATGSAASYSGVFKATDSIGSTTTQAFSITTSAITYATWDSAKKASWVTLAGLVATGDAAHVGAGIVLGTVAMGSKQYFEGSFTPSADTYGIGLAKASGSYIGYLGQPTDQIGHYLPGNDIYVGSSNVRNGTNNSVSPVVVGIAKDGNNIWIRFSGQPGWEGGGDPVLGTTPTYTITNTGTYYPACLPGSANPITLNAGQSAFTLWAPSGGFTGIF